MIKGINRQMIEVTQTGSPYFERAYLVVRGAADLPPEAVLHRLAGQVVQQAESYSGLRRQRRRQWLRRSLFAAGCILLGATLMWMGLRFG